MELTIHSGLLIGAVICFLLAVFNVPKINWQSLGLLLFVLSFLIH
jgi:hypothetical protein